MSPWNVVLCQGRECIPCSPRGFAAWAGRTHGAAQITPASFTTVVPWSVGQCLVIPISSGLALLNIFLAWPQICPVIAASSGSHWCVSWPWLLSFCSGDMGLCPCQRELCPAHPAMALGFQLHCPFQAACLCCSLTYALKQGEKLAVSCSSS